MDKSEEKRRDPAPHVKEGEVVPDSLALGAICKIADVYFPQGETRCIYGNKYICTPTGASWQGNC